MEFNGLSAAAVDDSCRANGANVLTQLPPEPLWRRILRGFRDPMIMILLAALLIQLVLFLLDKTEWFEPAAIFIAIAIANGVSAISEHNQQNKASALKAEEEAKEMAKVVRDGRLTEVHISEIVVGDIVFLQSGDKIAADGEIVDGNIKVDQAALNGETEEAAKCPVISGEEAGYDPRDLLNRHYAYRGTVVCSGEAYMQVKVVGDRTLFGELALEVQEPPRATPLQVKLAKLARQISLFGYVGAGAIIAGILLRTVFSGNYPADAYGWLKLSVDAITVAVTIIVCAVPEGLPMLTSILLSLQSLKMAKDNVLVRKINGLETAGSLSLLFSDKTGTITEGRLSVVELLTGDLHKFTTMKETPAPLAREIAIGIGLNNSASSNGGHIIGGNSTDRALMAFYAGNGCDPKMDKNEVRAFNAFDSARKFSSVTISHDGIERTYIKGAPERLLARCTSYVDGAGRLRPLTDRTPITGYMDEQAARSMRLLAVARCDGNADDAVGGELTLVCLLCIRDNVRKEAVAAITDVRHAGIQVVMITGDRKETAVAIARDAGLLCAPDDIAMTSAELAEKTDDELKAIIPHLRVIARALPTDKSRLVRLAQELNLVVGMTGDGVNDSPALKKADVGFAMGSGTEVAKSAGDITILDDNFSSIRKAILYGRTMFKSIRKFLVFQLTVNVAAVMTCFLGPLFGETIVLTVIQLLLINLAMDSLVAIAFGSEPPLPEYMDEKPVPRSAPIISGRMMVQVLTAAGYITAACLAILFYPPVRSLFGNHDMTYLKSAMFATFMMAITFNGFNARTTHLNPFNNLGRNPTFLWIMGLILLLQFLFITFGGKMLQVTPLDVKSWMICIVLAIMVLPLDFIRRLATKGK